MDKLAPDRLGDAYTAGWREGVTKAATIASNLPSIRKISEKHVKAMTPKDVAREILKVLE